MRTPGAYRKLIVHPKQLRWQWVGSPDPIPVPVGGATTGLNSIPPATRSSHATSESAPHSHECEGSGGVCLTAESGDGGRTLELSFSLKPSSYATVLLREITKSSML